jgi:hypothetical protein
MVRYTREMTGRQPTRLLRLKALLQDVHANNRSVMPLLNGVANPTPRNIVIHINGRVEGSC